ncbi:hypothetical protein Btru_058882 [Bulinus truncatus]|nr:hypothetical protein Btru_058882 [Bulinus truncatus]
MEVTTFDTGVQMEVSRHVLWCRPGLIETVGKEGAPLISGQRRRWRTNAMGMMSGGNCQRSIIGQERRCSVFGWVMLTYQKTKPSCRTSVRRLLPVRNNATTQRITLLGNGTSGRRCNIEVPEVKIVDSPRFAYRGLMMDIARSFHSKDEILAVIEVCYRDIGSYRADFLTQSRKTTIKNVSFGGIRGIVAWVNSTKCRNLEEKPIS